MNRILSFLMGRLLKQAAPADEAQSLVDDFGDELDELVRQRGLIRGWGWALAQILLSASTLFRHHILWSFIMLTNYLKTAFRMLKKQKGYSAINILGLSIGMAACMFILFWVQDELSFDRFHRNANRLFLVESEWHYGGETHIWDATPAPLAPALVQDFPDIEAAVRMKSRYGTHVRWGEKAFLENAFYCVSPSFFSVFDFPLISGQPGDWARDPQTLMISQRMAEKYFGQTSPLGQVVEINQKLAFTVRGVFENFPANSHLQIDFIAPFSALGPMNERQLDDWGRFDFLTFVLARDGVTASRLQEQLAGYLKQQRPNADQRLLFTPMTRIHLYSPNGTGNILYVRLFTLIGVVVLLVACINFVNLSTARATLRGREIGVRKVVGAGRRDLIRQLLGESFLFAFIAFFAALVLVCLLLPAFNNLSAKHLDFSRVIQPQILLGLLGIVSAAGLLSGIYPAVYLSAFHPLKTLGQARGGSTSGSALRKVLVVLQFGISIALVIGTLVVGSQIHYIRNKNLGFDKENLVYVPLNRQSLQSVDVLKAELLNHPAILKIAATDQVPVNQGNFTTISRWDGNDGEKRVMFHGMSADIDYFDLMGMTLVEGRGFSEERSEPDIVVNQEAVRRMGLEFPVGKKMAYWSSAGRIVGVVKDFHFKPLRDEIMPLFISFEPRRYNKLLFRIQGGQVPQALEAIETAMKRVAPDYPFTYHFLDQRIDAMYRTETRTGAILNALTALIIMTSCMGLFGLAAFTAQRRTKEIGIRKTLGASVPGISMLLAGEFIRLVVLANVLAWPLGYLAMHRWLQNFTYKIALNPWYFVGSALVALVIAVLTVSAQSVKAGLSNPVESLKVE